MTTLAIIDPNLPRQIEQNPSGLEGVELIFTGRDPALLIAASKRRRPDVVIINTKLLGDDPPTAARRLAEDTRADLVIALYTFAKREFIQAMNNGRVRAMKEPTSLEQLRSQMMSLIVKDLFSSTREQSARAPIEPHTAPFAEGAPDRKFSDAALSRLCEIESSIDCECPNHLAQIITSLAAFEQYSISCKNRDDEDAKMHGLLASASGKARATMEDVLQKLLMHEGIAV